ncbi:hypothetical protein C2845_PM11G12650 [Panicum miliaceum]|uniref:phospholipase D n=1 Tax=Panicum miliaceum TaxID=4540 RepID=A0A3L6RUW8_PANMI|nr:hypothetical protein C2845_PM11G12650 [Panicum miliaceum]
MHAPAPESRLQRAQGRCFIKLCFVPATHQQRARSQLAPASNPMYSSSGAGGALLLHGDLDLTIHEARGLPNMDVHSTLLRRLCLCPPAARMAARPSRSAPDDESAHHHRIRRRRKPRQPHGHRVLPTSDPHAAVVAPRWEASFLLPLAHRAARLDFHVKDADPFGSDLIGTASLSAAAVLAAADMPIRSEWLALARPDGRGPPKPGSAIRISARFVPAGRTPAPWRPGGGGGVPAYFPPRRGCDVRLYQDAHVGAGEVDGVPGAFEPGRCWEDLCLAVLGAQHLVYVAGWSVFTRVRLLRGAMSPEMEVKALGGVAVEDMCLGELLKYKSQEGVRVLLLVWDDKTSHDNFFLRTRGVMQTHDEETKKFFRHSSVICLLSPRSYYSPLQMRAEKLDGPAAYDVLDNFEQRWRKTKKLRLRGVLRFGKKAHWKEDALLKLERIPWILSPAKADAAGAGNDDEQQALHVLPEHDPERWHAQVFRSVDAGSLKRFPCPWDGEAMARHHLLCDKNVAAEQSIHTAYVRAIRSAERFVYIENQHFIGSSHAWPSYRHPGAGNLVPMEVALRVAAKIRAGEPFAAYVVIPMWPEGDPGSGPAQEILFWQSQTMEMMYGVIAGEIERARLRGAHPQQYLNFYCLGNREPEEEVAGDGHCLWPPADRRPDGTSPAAMARRHRRFMVYVHSKGMIVDDEYVVVGSANINQRSLAGSRDTEIAVGAYQPHHVLGRQRHPPPRGKVFGYRMSLWEEHLGKEAVRRWPEVVRRPESRECVELVNDIARDNWERYAADDGRAGALRGHLMRYPVLFGADGKVAALPGHETFPDVGGRVLGSPTNLPDYLTM